MGAYCVGGFQDLHDLIICGGSQANKDTLKTGECWSNKVRILLTYSALYCVGNEEKQAQFKMDCIGHMNISV